LVLSGNEFAAVNGVIRATEPLPEIVIAGRAERVLIAIEVDLLVTSDQGKLPATVAVAVGHDTSYV
jgi:hypothetical protein